MRRCFGLAASVADRCTDSSTRRIVRRRVCCCKYQTLAFKLSATVTPWRSRASTILPAPSYSPQNMGPPR